MPFNAQVCGYKSHTSHILRLQIAHVSHTICISYVLACCQSLLEPIILSSGYPHTAIDRSHVRSSSVQATVQLRCTDGSSKDNMWWALLSALGAWALYAIDCNMSILPVRPLVVPPYRPWHAGAAQQPQASATQTAPQEPQHSPSDWHQVATQVEQPQASAMQTAPQHAPSDGHQVPTQWTQYPHHLPGGAGQMTLPVQPPAVPAAHSPWHARAG